MSKRPTPRRSGLQGSPVDPPPAPAGAAADESIPEPTPAAPAEPMKPAPKTPPAKVNAESDTVRLGVGLPPAEFAAAKAAYLADWQSVRRSDMFRLWIADAIATHAARTAAERGRLTVTTRPGRSGSDTRSFDVDVDVLERMRAAITEDNVDGRWPSESAWAADAIAAAVDAARERAGGQLPTPPARLPRRLR